ncbi:MAG: RlmE family RNA methyltransferase [Methanomicrobiales archaeon]|nr:RlmE family RNA methyltransferase [Methanomicrobiales archaeon]
MERWGDTVSRWSEDRLHIRAKREGYRSRAAYKLIEIQQRFHVIRKNDCVIDLGAAPGSWLQVAREFTNGQVTGVDLNEIQPLEGVLTIRGDFSEPKVQEGIAEIVPRVDLIVSDASPRITGHRSLDQARAIGLNMDVLVFADRFLVDDGRIIIKSFQGDLFQEFLSGVRGRFGIVHLYRPHATRRGSAEIYVIGKRFRGSGAVADRPVRQEDHEP